MTNAQIEQVRDEAEEAGDRLMTAMCRLALGQVDAGELRINGVLYDEAMARMELEQLTALSRAIRARVEGRG